MSTSLQRALDTQPCLSGSALNMVVFIMDLIELAAEYL
jgi:hypothetical protein